MRRIERGMTLLEVVLAIALLAAIAVVVLPILVDATRIAAAESPSIAPSELRALASEKLLDEGVIAAVRKSGRVEVALTSPEGEHAAQLRLIPGEGPLPHDWIEVACGDTRVLWYVAPPEYPDHHPASTADDSTAAGSKAGSTSDTNPPPGQKR